MIRSDSLWDAWFAFLDSVNFTVTALTACFVLYTQCAGAVYFATGAVLCTLSIKVLKRIIRQPRPPNLPGRKLKVSYGMPSTHSATISYYATYIFLGCLYLPVHPTLPSSLTIRIVPPLITFPCAVTIIMSRVWLGHHTIPQVVAGISYGVGCASVWFALWTRGLHSWGGHAEQVVNHWINATFAK